ncbi:hypothetical protein OS493_031786 [Desmophyllum pertusum]|uniref:Uncharacterized protein n=1 Tax=Desmophyllum pertusum TaxID=174260 RepID=A0A9X0CVA2_9CNID|nr:hypothetical protein OS493_031786 [Desmophyllum pertusum]
MKEKRTGDVFSHFSIADQRNTATSSESCRTWGERRGKRRKAGPGKRLVPDLNNLIPQVLGIGKPGLKGWKYFYHIMFLYFSSELKINVKCRSRKMPPNLAEKRVESNSGQPTTLRRFFQEKIVMLKSMLRYGVISCKLEDFQIWDPKFEVPDYIRKSLRQKYRDTPVAGVRIVLGVNGRLTWYVDPKLKELSWKEGLQVDANETLLLKTRLRYGLVSFQEDDLHFRYGDWEIPQHIANSLTQKYLATPCAELCIFSGEKGKLSMYSKSDWKKGKST